MLKHPTLDLLSQLGLAGMAKAFADFAANDEAASFDHAEWLALLLDHEMTYRNDRRLALRLRHARLRHHAVPEDVNYRAPRGLDRRLFDMLLKGDWIDNHENLAGRYWPDGYRKKLVGLRHRPQGLPGQSLGALHAAATPDR
jgi:DNA replication protein DnaC